MKLNIIIVNYFIVMGNLIVETYDIKYTICENNDSLKKHHIIPLGEMLKRLIKNYSDLIKEACRKELRHCVPIGVNFMVKLEHYGDYYHEYKTYWIHSVSPDKYIKHGRPISMYLGLLYNRNKLDNDKNLALLPDCKIIISDKQYELYKKITQ